MNRRTSAPSAGKYSYLGAVRKGRRLNKQKKTFPPDFVGIRRESLLLRSFVSLCLSRSLCGRAFHKIFSGKKGMFS